MQLFKNMTPEGVAALVTTIVETVDLRAESALLIRLIARHLDSSVVGKAVRILSGTVPGEILAYESQEQMTAHHVALDADAFIGPSLPTALLLLECAFMQQKHPGANRVELDLDERDSRLAIALGNQKAESTGEFGTSVRMLFHDQWDRGNR